MVSALGEPHMYSCRWGWCLSHFITSLFIYFAVFEGTTTATASTANMQNNGHTTRTDPQSVLAIVFHTFKLPLIGFFKHRIVEHMLCDIGKNNSDCNRHRLEAAKGASQTDPVLLFFLPIHSACEISAKFYICAGKVSLRFQKLCIKMHSKRVRIVLEISVPPKWKWFHTMCIHRTENMHTHANSSAHKERYKLSLECVCVLVSVALHVWSMFDLFIHCCSPVGCMYNLNVREYHWLWCGRPTLRMIGKVTMVMCHLCVRYV